MTELILVVEPNRESVIEALRIKVMLKKLGLAVGGITIKKGVGEHMPLEFIEDFLMLKLVPDIMTNSRF
ncbi:MAG: hypothetical protein V3T58_05585 [Candidatus Hydrothermarchaeales archaeon]